MKKITVKEIRNALIGMRKEVNCLSDQELMASQVKDFCPSDSDVLGLLDRLQIPQSNQKGFFIEITCYSATVEEILEYINEED